MKCIDQRNEAATAYPLICHLLACAKHSLRLQQSQSWLDAVGSVKSMSRSRRSALHGQIEDDTSLSARN